MEYRLFVLLLRLGLALLGAVALGLVLWFIGSVTAVPFFPANDAAVTANLVIGIGLGAWVAGWFLGLRMGSSHIARREELPVVRALALTGAWLGQVFLDDALYRNVDAVRVKDAPEVYGAVTGAVVGALLVPLAVGVWRVAHREEP
jgi:hypothetical protein